MCPVKVWGETSSACSSRTLSTREGLSWWGVSVALEEARSIPRRSGSSRASSHEGISSGHVATKGRRSGCNFHWVGCSVNHQKALAGSGTVGAGSDGGGCGVD